MTAAGDACTEAAGCAAGVETCADDARDTRAARGGMAAGCAWDAIGIGAGREAFRLDAPPALVEALERRARAALGGMLRGASADAFAAPPARAARGVKLGGTTEEAVAEAGFAGVGEGMGEAEVERADAASAPLVR